jgi:DNA-binding GntR family transcriptional regulator
MNREGEISAAMGDKKNLTLTVYDSIKEMMVNYDIVPGQRLVFVDLAKQLGVSRTPVNNALSILAKEGYLDFVPNQGYSVHKLTMEEAESLYEIREILEIGTIGKAIRNLTPEKIKALENKRTEYVAAISDRTFRRLFVLDTEYHATIMGMVDNLYLIERYRDICQRIFLRIRTEDLRLDRQREIVKEHDALFEAVTLRDVEYAKELIRTHNANAKKNLFAIIFSEGQNGLLLNPPL